MSFKIFVRPPTHSVFKKLGNLAGAEEGVPRLSTGIDSKIYRLSDKIISRHVVAVRQGPHGNEKKKKKNVMRQQRIAFWTFLLPTSL